MSSNSADAGYRQVTSTAIPEISTVRLYRETLLHIYEEHPEVATVGEEGVLEAINAPSQVFASRTDPENSFVFVSSNVTYEGNPLYVPVRRVARSSGRVATAYFRSGPYSSLTLWERDDGN